MKLVSVSRPNRHQNKRKSGHKEHEKAQKGEGGVIGFSCILVLFVTDSLGCLVGADADSKDRGGRDKSRTAGYNTSCGPVVALAAVPGWVVRRNGKRKRG